MSRQHINYKPLQIICCIFLWVCEQLFNGAAGSERDKKGRNSRRFSNNLNHIEPSLLDELELSSIHSGTLQTDLCGLILNSVFHWKCKISSSFDETLRFARPLYALYLWCVSLYFDILLLLLASATRCVNSRTSSFVCLPWPPWHGHVTPVFCFFFAVCFLWIRPRTFSTLFMILLSLCWSMTRSSLTVSHMYWKLTLYIKSISCKYLCVRDFCDTFILRFLARISVGIVFDDSTNFYEIEWQAYKQTLIKSWNPYFFKSNMWCNWNSCKNLEFRSNPIRTYNRLQLKKEIRTNEFHWQQQRPWQKYARDE